MKALVVTYNGNTYTTHGPLNVEEATSLTREAYLVILLCDLEAAKKDEDYSKFQECVANSPLYCRAEKQIKTMEFIIGMSLSSIVKPSEFEAPTKVSYNEKIT